MACRGICSSMALTMPRQRRAADGICKAVSRSWMQRENLLLHGCLFLRAVPSFYHEGLLVWPVWFGRRVRIQVHDDAGMAVAVQSEADSPLTDKAVLYFGRDDEQTLRLPSRGKQLAVSVRLDEQAVRLQSYSATGPVVNADVIPPATASLAGLAVYLESEYYVTLEMQYFPGRKLLYFGLGLAIAGLSVLGLWRIFPSVQFRV